MRRPLIQLNLYGREAFFSCFCPYVRQPHNHIGWATLMAFALINFTNPRTNLWNFREKILRIGDFENLSFFESPILIFFLLHSYENQSIIIGLRVKILMITLFSSPKQPFYTNVHTVDGQICTHWSNSTILPIKSGKGGKSLKYSKSRQKTEFSWADFR